MKIIKTMALAKGRKRKRLTCDLYGCRRRVDAADDYCYGCRRLVCVRCAFRGGHFGGGRHA